MKKIKLELYIFFILISIFIGIGLLVQYNYSKEILVEGNKTSTVEVENVISKQISDKFKSLKRVVDELAEYIEINEYSDDELLDYLKIILSNNVKFMSVYYGTKENEMINGSGWIPPENFDLTTRPWFIEAMNNKEIIVTDAFLNASKDSYIVTMAKAIYIDNEFKGVVGADVRLAEITKVLSDIERDSNEFSIIINSDNQVIAYSETINKDVIEEITIKDISDDLVIPNIIENNYIEEKTINGEPGYLVYNTIKETGWKYITFVPFSKFLKAQDSLRSVWYFIFTILIVLSIVLFYIVNYRILKPISNLSKNINAINIDNDLNYRLIIEKNNPTNRISLAINYLLNRINNLIDKLKKEEEKGKAIILAIPDLVFVINKEGICVECYTENDDNLLIPKKEFINKSINLFLPTDVIELATLYRKEVLKTGIANNFSYTFEINGKNEYYECRYAKINDSTVLAIVRDITIKREQELRVKASENNFKQIFENSSDTILIISDLIIVDCNNATLNMFDFDEKDSIIGKNPWELSPIRQAKGQDSEQLIKIYINNTKNMINERFEFYFAKRDGKIFPVEIILTNIIVNGKEIIHALLRDVSELKVYQEKLEFLSYHDQLTKLYNRWFFQEEIRRLDVKRNLPITIILGDVNGLKLVNDSFGHGKGDQLLINAANSIIKGCREDDIIARIGGDEFAIILPNSDEYQAEKIVKRIKDLANNENIGVVELSISFGWETKYDVDDDMMEIIKKAEDRMYKKKIFESPSMRGNTINTIIKTLHEKNKREEQHSIRVSEYCEKLGMALNMKEDDINELKSAGLLHDIGKIGVDEYILNKPGKLTDAEYEEIKKHSEIGYRILSTVRQMSEIANNLLYHHERWEGNGYPRGLSKEDIPLHSRIIAIADSYDAMTSERTYKKVFTKEQAIKELHDNIETQFDSNLIDVFIERVLKKE